MAQLFKLLKMGVRMHARLGVQMEFTAKQFSNSMPSFASRSIVGVGFSFANRLPYAPMAVAAWSSDMM